MSRAALGSPEQAAIPTGAEAGHRLSCGQPAPAEALQPKLQRGLQGRAAYSPVEEQT